MKENNHSAECQLLNSLKEMAQKIAEQSHCGEKDFLFDEIAEEMQIDFPALLRQSVAEVLAMRKDVETAEDLIKDLKKALEGDDVDEIKSAKDKLQEKAMTLATKAYEEAAKARQGESGSEDTASDDKKDDVQEANYEEK